MAEISYTATSDGSSIIVTWSAVTQADTFEALKLDDKYKSLFVEVNGTFSSATAAIQHSIDGTNYYTGKIKGTGAASTLTAAGAFSLIDETLYIKPLCTGGVAQSVNVKLFARR